MKEQAQLTFLGTGGSAGVPLIGCSCAVCTSQDLKNKRLRSSALLEIQGKKILIDCGPDFRQQALKLKVDRLDGVIITHGHYDHIGGLDDLRALQYRQREPLPCLLSIPTEKSIEQAFHYFFIHQDHAFTTRLDFQCLHDPAGQIEFLGIPFHFFTYEQLKMPVNGFVFARCAYITDIKNYENHLFDHLQGIDTLVLSALRFSMSPMHLSVDEAIDFARKTSAKQVYFMHISHDLDHEKANTYLPANMQMAYDGLQISLN